MSSGFCGQMGGASSHHAIGLDGGNFFLLLEGEGVAPVSKSCPPVCRTRLGVTGWQVGCLMESAAGLPLGQYSWVASWREQLACLMERAAGLPPGEYSWVASRRTQAMARPPSCPRLLSHRCASMVPWTSATSLVPPLFLHILLCLLCCVSAACCVCVCGLVPGACARVTMCRKCMCSEGLCGAYMVVPTS